MLFINGEQLYKRGRNQNTLGARARPAAARRLPSCSATSTASPASSTSTRSTRNDYNLNIPLYVAPADTGEKVTLADALADLEAAQAKAAPRPGRRWKPS